MDYKEILKSCSLKGKDLANRLGLSYSSYRSLVVRGTPRWIKAFEYGYELGSKKEEYIGCTCVNPKFKMIGENKIICIRCKK